MCGSAVSNWTPGGSVPWHNKKRGKWIGRVMIDGHRQQVGEYDTKREALAAELEFRERHRVAPNKLTVAQLRERWLRDYGQQADWSPDTRLHMEERTAKFLAEHQKRRVSDFQVAEAHAWAAEHPSTLREVRSMFNYGVTLQALVANPFASIKRSRKGRQLTISKGRGALTEEEVALLADVAREKDGEWHRALILVAAFTGIREGELYGLKHSDLGEDTLHVARAWKQKTRTWGPPKNRQERTVIYPRQARDAVALVERSLDSDFVFVSPERRQHLTRTSHYYYWYRVRDSFTDRLPVEHWLRQRVAAHGEKLKFHELRHTCATLLLERGVPAEAVARQLGHSDNGKLVLSTYGHPNEQRMLDQVRVALDRPAPGERVSLRSVEGGSAS